MTRKNSGSWGVYAVLRRSYVHLKGVGAATEQLIWSAGCFEWDDFIQAGGGRWAAHMPAILESCRRYNTRDWRWFERAFPATHKWRIFGDLGAHALYVDIETTGWFDGDAITLVGAFDGRRVHHFIAERNLDEAADFLERYPLIITYNGKLFDMPLIRNRFPRAIFNHVHIDLRYPLRHLGLTGGLKKIERVMGLVRSRETDGLNGWDAVRLWREHQCGSHHALDQLLAYNAEDVRNLKPLMEYVFEEGCRRLDVTPPASCPLQHETPINVGDDGLRSVY